MKKPLVESVAIITQLVCEYYDRPSTPATTPDEIDTREPTYYPAT